MPDTDTLYDKAYADHPKYAGKIVGVTYAMIGDGTDIEGRSYPRNRPLLVRICKRDLDDHDINPDRELIDTYYDADALPGQLGVGFYVSWIDGPTYYNDGRVETPTWVGEPQSGVRRWIKATVRRLLNAR